MSQVNLHFPFVTEANAGGFATTECHLSSVYFPIISPIERRFKMLCHLDSNRPDAGLRGHIVIITPHQLNVKRVGLMLGWRRSIQHKRNKQHTQNSASHKAQHVEL
jgi:hypothetical protein